MVLPTLAPSMDANRVGLYILLEQ